MPKLIICAKCGEEKPHHAKGLCKLCHLRLWQRKNPSRVAAQRRRYREVHREEVNAYNRRYCAEHRKDQRAYSHRYRRENPDQNRRWQQQNPQRLAIIGARRRARKNALPNTLTLKQVAHLLAIGQAMYPGEELHLDHIVPLSKGGGTTLANMHAIPAGLNCSKKNKLPQEVYRQLELEGGEEPKRAAV